MLKGDDVFADRFVVEQLAGTGGMGRVYRALDRVSGERVALKVMLDPEGAERFAREARLLAELRHPGIVRYVAHGRTPQGETYIAMEWLEGETLSARLKREPLSAAEALGLVTAVAEALSMAHARGIVHRDIKPANLLLVDRRLDQPKLLDFGIAHLSQATAVVTRTGAVLGTLGYMAPEQARGDPNPSTRADVFSLGCILFHCLTGRPAFTGAAAVAVLAKLILEQAPRLVELRPACSRELDHLVARMLSKDPASRPPDAGAVLAELRSLPLDDLDLPPPSTSASEVLTGSEQRLVCVLLANTVLPAETGAFDPGATVASVDAAEPPTRIDAPRGSRPPDAVFRSLRSIALRHGAVIEPLRDGSIAALLSGQLSGGAATDLTTRAARCALSIRSVLPEAAIALATGRGVIGDRLPVGEVIERAVTMIRHGDPSIVLDRVTAGLLDVRFEVGGLDDGALTLLGERRIADVTRKLLGTPTRTIGRERELGFLLGTFEECTSEPMARVAVVTGPAGVGKSRLRYELVRRLEARVPEAEVWIARGDPVAAGSPFGLLGQVVRRVAGIFDGEPLPVSREKLSARVGRHVVESDVDRVAAFLGEVARVPYPAEGRLELEAARRDAVLMGDQTRRAWIDFVGAECEQRPLLLVLEDLHWGDLPTVSFVDAALREARDLPFMVLALARPEVTDHFGGLWSQRDPQELRLGGLTRKASEKLVRQVLGDALDDAAVARIVERSEGNAFFLEELIRSAAGGEAEALPETLVAMVQGRLEALPDGARRVLRAASVFGGVFWDAGVASMTGQEPASALLADWLDLLIERELVIERPHSRFPGTRELVFRHDLVRGAAYEMLTPEDRELGHRLAGAWLEESGEPDAVVLAGHFERGGASEQAFRWYRVAAEEALDANDFAAALASVDRATACQSEANAFDLGELEHIRAEGLYWRGEHAAALASARRALELLEPGSDGWYETLALCTTAAHRAGEVDEEAAIGCRLLDEGWADKPGAAAVIGCARATVALIQSGHYSLADRILERMEPNVKDLADDPGALARWQASLAARALHSGNAGEYLVLSGLAADSSRRAGDLRSAVIQQHNFGHANLELGRWAIAEQQLEAVVTEAERLCLRNVVASAKNNLGFALARQGRQERALALLYESIQELERQSDLRMLGGACNHLAQVLLELGELDVAEQRAEQAVRVLGAFPPLLCQAMATLARVLLARGGAERAVAVCERAISLLDSLGSMADGEISLRLAHAEALEAAGHLDAAREALALARDRLTSRADAIGDAAVRSAFLEQVPEHVRALELAAARGL